MPAISVFCVAGSLTGCVAFPVAIPQERPFIDVAAESLQPAVTTQQEILARFGPPHLRAEREWIYRNTRLGWQFAGCVAANYSGSCGVSDRGATEYFLHIELNELGVLSEYAVYSQPDFCEERGICISGRLVSLAVDESDFDDLASATTVDACIAYFFPRNDSSASGVYVDFEYVGDLVDRDSYFLLQLPPGKHNVRIDINRRSIPGGGTDFECEPGSVQYLRFHGSVLANRVRVQQIDEQRGSRAIENRWRARRNDDYEVVSSRSLRDGEIVAFTDADVMMVYEYDTEGGVESFGTGSVKDSCGLLAAMVEYDLTPAGELTDLHLLDNRQNAVQLTAVCGAIVGCRLRPMLGDEPCPIEPIDTIVFELPEEGSDTELLIVEPSTELASLSEIYFDSAAKLVPSAQCNDVECRISVARLRTEFAD